MTSWFELECICGAVLKESERGSDGAFRCGSCGAEISFEAPAGFDEPARRGTDPGISDPALTCPSCGAGAELVRRGPGDRDRFLSCAYCGTEVDLPEVRGTTRERVVERPNERIVERVTSWEGAEPDAIADEAFGTGSGTEIAVEMDGRRFDSREALERHLRDRFPADVAAQVLDAVERGLASGDVRVETTVIERRHVRTDTPSRPGRRRR